MLESIGSSVKLTNIEISTAATMVTPNSWKNLPMMPPMKPMGRNTATMEKVVASTARPISCVPSSEAWYGPLPICTWRTMFSRTTMASSISRPTHSDSAISVIMLMVKPNRFMNRKVPMMEIGSVSPVMTVERQELRNRNTMSTVSSAPSISVRRTFSTATRIGPRAVGDELQPRAGRQQRLDVLDGLVQSVDHGNGVFVLGFLHRQQQRALAVVKRQAVDFLRAVGDARDLVDGDGRRRAAGRAFARHDDLAEVFGPLHARVDLDDALLLQRADGAHRQVLVFVRARR
jgi:hypothetical protein